MTAPFAARDVTNTPTVRDRVLDGYRFDLSCPRCGGNVVHHADGAPQAGTSASAIARCEPCGIRLLVCTTLRPIGRWSPSKVTA